MTVPTGGKPTPGEPTPGEPALRRTVLADEVYERLKARIMGNLIEPDAPMRIEVLARQLGVSPTPVREALARLESDSLVTKYGLKGYRTNPVINRDEFSDLWEFRLHIEPWAAELAARRGADDRLAALRREAETPAGPGAELDFTTYRPMQEHDQRFHRLVFEAAGNVTAGLAFERTHAHLRAYRVHAAARMGSAGLAEHRAIAAAIARRDPTAARRSMTEHLTASRDRMLPFVPR